MRIATFGCLAVAMALAAPALAQTAAGPVDEVKLGLLDHDVQLGGEHHEPGVDGNAEVLFVSPGVLAPIWAPRPNLGVTVNSAGKNSYAYGGLVWTASFLDRLYADFGLGGAVHDGPDISSTPDHKGLGTRALFHEAIDLGYRITPAASVELSLDHISNADLGTRNPGLTNLGLRVGWTF